MAKEDLTQTQYKTLSILNVIQAVLLLVKKEKNKLENQALIDAVNEKLLNDILNFDE